MAVLVPALSKARKQARGIVCLSNLNQIGKALATHLAENGDVLPPETGYTFLDVTKDWGWGISWQHCLVYPQAPRESVLSHKGNRGLVGLRCPYWPAQYGGFAETYGTTGGYAINDNLDGVLAWKVKTGGDTQPKPASYVTPKVTNFKRKSGELMFVTEVTGADENLDGKLDWSKESVENWGAIEKRSSGRGAFVTTYHGWLRADHGDKSLSGPLAFTNLTPFSSESSLLQQKTNALFVDQHVRKVTMKELKENTGMWMPY
jgi:hypothetical protein